MDRFTEPDNDPEWGVNDDKTAEILQEIKERGFYDDFIEMMDKDCFDEAAAVFGKAEESLNAPF